MTYHEILSNALRLSDTERRHLIGTLGTIGIPNGVLSPVIAPESVP